MLTIIELAGFISIFIIVNRPNAHNHYDFIMILILFISISIAFSEKSLLQNFSNNKMCYFLEKISLPMFLNQMWIIDLSMWIMKQNNITLSYYIGTLINIILIFVSALITEQLVKLMKKNYIKLRKLIIS